MSDIRAAGLRVAAGIDFRRSGATHEPPSIPFYTGSSKNKSPAIPFREARPAQWDLDGAGGRILVAVRPGFTARLLRGLLLFFLLSLSYSQSRAALPWR